jgi:hypothetical protein
MNIPPAPSLSAFLSLLWYLFKTWWWFMAPFILFSPFKFLWHWWRVYMWLRTIYKPILYEVKLPKESLKPVRAMEDVMNSINSVVWQPPDWWEKWIEGQIQTSVGFEMASIGGEIHMYFRCHADYKDGVEAAIYSQYPEAEITEAQDYTKLVPHNIPNKDWDMWATDYKLDKPDYLPIATYKTFEPEKAIEAIEEKRIDPVASLFEAMSKVKPGEQLWIQISATPQAQEVADAWIAKVKVERDKLARREVSSKGPHKPIVLEALEFLVTGKAGEEEKKEEPVIPVEMKLTPGEREVVHAVEQKMSKPLFFTNIRFIWLGKRDIFFKSNFRLGFTFFGSYYTHNLNALRPVGDTLTKIHKSWFLPINILKDRRNYLRKRKIFRHYTNRITPLFPPPQPVKYKFMLNSEELASLFHFPSWRVSPVPGVSRVEAKRKAPPEIPLE